MAWWEKMPKPLQAWLTIISIILGLVGASFAMGATTSATVVEVRSLPQRVDALEARSVQHEAAIYATNSKLDKMLCLLVLPDSLAAIEGEQRCP